MIKFGGVHVKDGKSIRKAPELTIGLYKKRDKLVLSPPLWCVLCTTNSDWAEVVDRALVAQRVASETVTPAVLNQ